jgi:hypothetical protein
VLGDLRVKSKIAWSSNKFFSMLQTDVQASNDQLTDLGFRLFQQLTNS